MIETSQPIEAPSAPSSSQSGMQLDSILSALAAMPVPPPAPTSTHSQAQPPAPAPAAPVQGSPRGATPTQVVQRHFAHVPTSTTAFYQNTFSDPAWYKSHSHTMHSALPDTAKAAESVKSKHVPLEHVQDSSKKFYENTFQDPGWKISHSHTVHAPLDRSLPPYSSLPCGIPSGKGSEQHADLPPPPVAEMCPVRPPPAFAPEPAMVPPKASLQTSKERSGGRLRDQAKRLTIDPNIPDHSNHETQEYYLDARHGDKHHYKNTFAESQQSNDPSAFLPSDRPKKSSRYLAQHYLVSPLEYSKDYIAPDAGGPAAPPSAKNRRHMNHAKNNELFHSEAVADVLVSQEADTAALGELDPLYNKTRNDRFSRKDKRIKAAANIPEEKFIPKMAVATSYLGHQLRTKDASKSGFVNFDEFKSALKQADILLSYEEYLAVFDKFTSSSGNTQAPVPVRSAGSTPRETSSPPSASHSHTTGGDFAKAVAAGASAGASAGAGAGTLVGSAASSGRNSPTAEEQKTREEYKGFVGSLSAGKVLHIGDFLDDVKNIAESDAKKKQLHVHNAPLPAHMMPSHKHKRNVFFKVLHSLNKASDPARVFRYLDDELIGHLRPRMLQEGLERLGASLSNSEFNTLLKGVGYNDPKGEEFINLESFDRILHDELGMGHGADSLVGNDNSTTQPETAASKSRNVSTNDEREEVGWEDHRRKKKTYTVPGMGQELQQQHQQHTDTADTRYVLTDKITRLAPPDGRTAPPDAAVPSSVAGDLTVPSAPFSRIEKMRAILQCLKPNQTEFTRMVESKHTRESSLKWCKLQSKLQSNANHVLAAFKKGEDLSRRRSHSHSSAYRRGHGDVPAVRTDDLSDLTIEELEGKLKGTGFVLGSEDKAIMRFHLQKQAAAAAGGGERAGSSEEKTQDSGNNASRKINLQSFCQAVGIPVEVTRSRYLDKGVVQQQMELQQHSLADGGIFACSQSQHNNNAVVGGNGGNSPVRAGVSSKSAASALQNTAREAVPDAVAAFNPNFLCTMYSQDDSFMKGMRKRHVMCPQGANVTNELEPWKFLALLEHGSNDIWPTVPASAQSSHKASGGSFHFTKRHIIQDSETSDTRRAGRASSVPPQGKRTYQSAGAPFSNSDQFRASQDWTPQQYQDEQRGRGRGRRLVRDDRTTTAGPVPNHTTNIEKAAANLQVQDMEKLRRWASKPLVEKYFAGKVDTEHREAITNASAAINQAGTVSSRSHHLSPAGVNAADSSRNMKHTLRKSSPFNSNARPSVTPFALDN